MATPARTVGGGKVPLDEPIVNCTAEQFPRKDRSLPAFGCKLRETHQEICMSDMKLLGRLTSGNVMKVTWTLAELDLPYTREDVGGKHGGNNAPAYLALNPNGLVPTLIDGSVVLWES